MHCMYVCMYVCMCMCVRAVYLSAAIRLCAGSESVCRVTTAFSTDRGCSMIMTYFTSLHFTSLHFTSSLSVRCVV